MLLKAFMESKSKASWCSSPNGAQPKKCAPPISHMEGILFYLTATKLTHKEIE